MGILMGIQTTIMYAHGHQNPFPAQWKLNEQFHCMPTPTSWCEYKDAAMFLQISNSSAILIFSARSTKWFFSSMPARELFMSTMMGQLVVNGIMFLPKGNQVSEFIHPITPHDIGMIWAYDIVFLFILDIVKQFMISLWESYELTTIKEDPFTAKQRRKSMNSTEANLPGRAASFKRVSAKRVVSMNIQKKK